jgi:transposase
VHVTPADEQDREQVGNLADAVQREAGASVELAYVDQGYTGERPADAARAEQIELSVVKRPQAKRGFVLLARRWVVERSLAWGPVPPTRPRLRAAAGDVRRHPLRRVRVPDGEEPDARHRCKCITRYRLTSSAAVNPVPRWRFCHAANGCRRSPFRCGVSATILAAAVKRTDDTPHVA